MTTPPPHYTYTHLKQGIATLASIVIQGREFGGLAICGPDDHYNKQRGECIALGRAVKNAEVFTSKLTSDAEGD